MTTVPEQSSLQLLAEVQCPKLSASATGLLTYRVWRDAPTLDGTESPTLYVALSKNDGGGYFSLEQVPMPRIESCLLELQATGKGFPAIRLKTMFEGKSANNPSFMAAVLRHEGILTGSPENPKLNLVTGDLAAWKDRLLLLPVIAAPAEETIADVAPATQNITPEPKPSKKRAKTTPPTPVEADTPTPDEEAAHEVDTPS